MKCKILPFRAVYYNPEFFEGDISDLVSLPYDVIGSEDEKVLKAKHPKNAIHFIYNPNASKQVSDEFYKRSAALISDAIQKGILKRNSEEGMYVLSETFNIGDRKYTRFGCFSLLSLDDDYCALPHEKVMQGPKQDRVRLMETVKGHLSPVFCLFKDKDAKVFSLFKKVCDVSTELMSYKFNGVDTKIYSLKDTGLLKELSDSLNKTQLFIADGHHRYEAALTLKNKCKGIGFFSRCLVYLVSVEDPGLVVLPTYRIISPVSIEDFEAFYKRLSDGFNTKTCSDLNECISMLNTGEDKGHFGFYYSKKGFFFVSIKPEKMAAALNNLPEAWQNLDVAILDEILIAGALKVDDKSAFKDRFSYASDLQKAVSLAHDKNGIAFFLKSTPVESVLEVASKGARMPHKSTYFFPKIPTGVVFNLLEP